MSRRYATTVRELLKLHLGQRYIWEVESGPCSAAAVVDKRGVAGITDRLTAKGWTVTLHRLHLATGFTRVYRGQIAAIRLWHSPYAGGFRLIIPEPR